MNQKQLATLATYIEQRIFNLKYQVTVTHFQPEEIKIKKILLEEYEFLKGIKDR